MDADRVRAELDMLRGWFTDLEYLEESAWVRLPTYRVPAGRWALTVVELCFQIPAGYPGQAPYAFYVRPDLRLADGNLANNYQYPVATGFGDGWGKFSWQIEPWIPGASPASGSNLVNFAQSFASRLNEGA